MKTEITLSGICILKAVMKVLYCFLKLFPAKADKILFCSRQSNEVPLDFVMIQEEMIKKIPDVKMVEICCHIGHSGKDYVRFAIATMRSMYHLATSKVCILDAYWPAVSILKHKRELKVIQIWHATGKIKKSGYQSLGKVSGRNERYAEALNMHGNYDYIIAGAPSWNRYYCEAFRTEESKLFNYGLPRIDYLLDTEEKNRKRFFDEFPELRSKEIVLYAPTFRRNMKSRWDEITKAFKNEDYVLIIKNHPGQMISKVNRSKRVYYMEDWKSIDLIAASDYFITDYSAIALEAAVLRKKTYYWVYDYDEYMENNGINIDLKEEMKPYVFKDAKDIVRSMKNDKYNMDVIDRYRDKYLPEDMGQCTEKITTLINKIIEEDFTGNEENSDNGRR